MVNADADGGQPKPNRSDAAGRGGRAVHHPIRNEAIRRICRVPKIIKISLLNVIQKCIITGKQIGNCGESGGRQAFLGSRGQCRDLVKIRMSIDHADTEITEARRGQHAALRDEWTATGGRTIHLVPRQVRITIWIPVQYNAFIP